MARGFWDWLMDDEYEQKVEIYADKDRFVSRIYTSTKKGTTINQIEGNNKTNKLSIKSTNPLLSGIGKLIELKQ